MKSQYIKKRKLSVIRDAKGRFLKWGKRGKFRYSLEERRKFKALYKKEEKEKRYIKPRSSERFAKLKAKDFHDVTPLTNVDYYEMNRPIKYQSGFLVLEIRFIKHGLRGQIVKDTIGRSGRHRLPLEYNKAFKEAFWVAQNSANMTFDDWEKLNEYYAYYLAK